MNKIAIMPRREEFYIFMKEHYNYNVPDYTKHDYFKYTTLNNIFSYFLAKIYTKLDDKEISKIKLLSSDKCKAIMTLYDLDIDLSRKSLMYDTPVLLNYDIKIIKSLTGTIYNNHLDGGRHSEFILQYEKHPKHLFE